MNQLKNMNIRAILVVALMLLIPSMMRAEKEAWVEYLSGTLTFHYDENRASSDAATYLLPASGEDPGWLEHRGDITKVFFDPGFRQVRPVRLTKWFYEMSALTDIFGLEYLRTDSVNDMSYAFYDCESLTQLDLSTFNTSNVTTMKEMFDGCTSLTELNLTSFNTEKVDNMYGMFWNCLKITTLDLHTFDTQRVTNMDFMFSNCPALTQINVSSRFVTDQVTESARMFWKTTNLPNYDTSASASSCDKTNARKYMTYPPIEAWAEYQEDAKTLTFHYDDYKSYTTATDKYNMPSDGQTPRWYSSDIEHVVFLSNFKDVHPANCSWWFYNLSTLTDVQGIEYLCTDSVTDMNNMFYGCEALKELDLSSFNTEGVTKMNNMFNGCSSLKTLDVTSFCTRNVEDMSGMFFKCKSLTSLNLGTFDTQRVTNMDRMFSFDNVLNHIYASDLFVTDQVTSSDNMFSACESLPNYKTDCDDKSYAKDYLTYLAPQPWVEYQEDTQTITFHNDNTQRGATATAKYDLPTSGGKPAWIGKEAEHVVIKEAFAQVHPKSCYMWFDELKHLTDIQGLENLCTDSVTDMSYMFYGCKALTQIDLSHFNTERVTTMESMFMGCEQLTAIDLSSFSTQQVSTMYAMFRNCSKLASLDLTSFDTQRVTNMKFMFANDTAITHIYVSDSFVTQQVSQSGNMFYNCLKLPSFDSQYTDITKAKVYLTYPQPWAEFQYATKTLTFHYDTKENQVTATDKNYLPAAGEDPGWIDCDVYYVVFDNNFASARPERCYKWFYNLQHLIDIQGIENLCTESVTDMSYMFYGCEMLTTLDLTTFDTQRVTNMDHMFRNSKRLTHVYVSESFVTDKVTQSYLMFQGCDALPNYKYAATNDKEYAHYNEASDGYLTLRRHATVGDTLYNIDGYAQPTCYDDVTFTDGAAYKAPCAFTFDTDKKTSYTRMVKNHWATLCLPFAFSAEDNPSASYYSVKSYTDGHITATPLTGEIAAGTPVLAYVTDGELSVSATGAAAVVTPATDDVLQGVFTQTEVADKDYIIANDRFWNALYLKENNNAAKNVYVAPYRASLTLDLSEGAKPNSISINDPTGVSDSLRRIEDTDPSALLDGAELYDLQGRRLAAPERGMMIIRKGGVSHKVVVR